MLVEKLAQEGFLLFVRMPLVVIIAVLFIAIALIVRVVVLLLGVMVSRALNDLLQFPAVKPDAAAAWAIVDLDSFLIAH